MTGTTKTSFTFFTKTAQNKSGVLKTSYVVKKTVRNEKGQFVSNKKILLPQTEATRFFEDVTKGKLSTARATGIFESYAKSTPTAVLKNGFNSMIQIMSDQHALSDLQKDRLAVLSDKMSVEDFENFYRRYQDDIDAVYKSSDEHRMRSPDGQILDWDVKSNISDKIINDMSKYLGVKKGDLDKTIKTENYDERGRLKFKQ